jgi:hypothetical protein
MKCLRQSTYEKKRIVLAQRFGYFSLWLIGSVGVESTARQQHIMAGTSVGVKLIAKKGKGKKK